MTKAGNFPNYNGASNLLYAKLRSRFCPNGDITLGERMLQASAKMKSVDTAFLSTQDSVENDMAYSEVVTASGADRRRTSIRNFCALFLTAVVLVSLMTSLFRVLGTSGERTDMGAVYPLSSVTSEQKNLDSSLHRTENGMVAVEGDELLDKAYDDFTDAFGK